MHHVYKLFPAFSLLLLVTGLSCSTQPRNPGMTRVTVAVNGISPETVAKVYTQRLKARDIVLIDIDTVSDRRQLTLRYEGSWPWEEVSALFEKPETFNCFMQNRQNNFYPPWRKFIKQLHNPTRCSSY